MAAQQQQQQQHLASPMQFAHLHQQSAHQQEQSQSYIRRPPGVNGIAPAQTNQEQLSMLTGGSPQQQLNSAITSMAVVANQTYLINSLQVVQQQSRNAANQLQLDDQISTTTRDSNQLLPSLPSSPHSTNGFTQPSTDQPLPLTQRNMQVQQLFTNILRLMAEQYALRAQSGNR